MASDAELAAMRQAIMLSALGLGGTSPNPPVGCVVLSPEGLVVGTGFHRRKGEAHAEVHALTAAGNSARGGTAVVTLEPCNHVGVTPACRQALLDAGIRRVIVGKIDPTSRGAGGAAVLSAAGVDVEVGVLEDEVSTVLQPWLTATTRERPFVGWAYTAGTQADDDALRELLRSTVDVIVSEERVDEGVPGGHSARHFRLADIPPFAEEPDTWLAAAHQAGARSILLVGRSKVAAALSAADAIDSLCIAAPRTFSPDPTSPVPLVSPSFEIVDVASWQNGLLIRTRRTRKA